MTTYRPHPCSMQRAFTLLEIAVVLVLVSLMAAFAVKITPSRDCYAETRNQQRDISAALDSYVRANNAYPKPAGRALGVNNPLYGVAITDSASTIIDRLAGDTNPDSAVLIGALPFVSLGLNTNYAADCWGNKFTYLVTERLTSNATYMNNTALGLITVRTGTLAAPSTLSSNAAYAVISHGKDALGASTRNNSSNKKYCVDEHALATLTRIDKENCDLSNKEVFASTFNDGSGAANFFDDLLVYANKTGYTGCNPTTATWGGHCSGPVGMLNHNDLVNVPNTAAGYTGIASVFCDNGSTSINGGTCSPTGAGACGAESVVWGNCAGSSMNLASGTSMMVINTAANYSGSVTVSCSGGTLSQSGASCNAAVAPSCSLAEDTGQCDGAGIFCTVCCGGEQTTYTNPRGMAPYPVTMGVCAYGVGNWP